MQPLRVIDETVEQINIALQQCLFSDDGGPQNALDCVCRYAKMKI